MTDQLSLFDHPLLCRCRTHPPLELRQHGGCLVLARFCPCGAVVDVRAKFLDWLAVSQFVHTLLDQAKRATS